MTATCPRCRGVIPIREHDGKWRFVRHDKHAYGTVSSRRCVGSGSEAPTPTEPPPR